MYFYIFFFSHTIIYLARLALDFAFLEKKGIATKQLFDHFITVSWGFWIPYLHLNGQSSNTDVPNELTTGSSGTIHPSDSILTNRLCSLKKFGIFFQLWKMYLKIKVSLISLQCYLKQLQECCFWCK